MHSTVQIEVVMRSRLVYGRELKDFVGSVRQNRDWTMNKKHNLTTQKRKSSPVKMKRRKPAEKNVVGNRNLPRKYRHPRKSQTQQILTVQL